MSNASEDSDSIPGILLPGKKKGQNEKHGGSVLKCFILTELGRARWENIWHSVMPVMTLGQTFSQAI